MNDTDVTADAATLPEALRLSPIEARVLGSLIEKEATTPDQYPLTENALTLACNQKTSRDPLMDLSSGEVGHALRQLETRQMVRSQHAARAQRRSIASHTGLWRHEPAAGRAVHADAARPQTLNEIFTRSERIGRFATVDEAPCARTPRPAQPGAGDPAAAYRGQREDRWTHLLCGPVDMEAVAPPRGPRPPAQSTGLLGWIEALEARIAVLEARLATPNPDARV